MVCGVDNLTVWLVVIPDRPVVLFVSFVHSVGDWTMVLIASRCFCYSDGWPVCVPQSTVISLEDLRSEEQDEVSKMDDCFHYSCSVNMR